MSQVQEFNDYREKMNSKILESDNKVLKRIFSVDTLSYTAGALPVKTKELIGLSNSLVLRCDDCVKYHLGKCKELKLATNEVHEALSIACLIGGTIVIPHLRRAFEFWEILQSDE